MFQVKKTKGALLTKAEIILTLPKVTLESKMAALLFKTLKILFQRGGGRVEYKNFFFGFFWVKNWFKGTRILLGRNYVL